MIYADVSAKALELEAQQEVEKGSNDMSKTDAPEKV